jgi:hypothetical protein
LPAPVFHYKTCSTFDSAPHVGSIGVAVAVLREFIRNPFVPIVGGQPNLDRYCVFGNLYAAIASGEPVVRIDRHPTMSRHPVTPMHEADLRLHLQAQGLERVVNIDYRMYDRPADVQDAAIDRIVAGDARAVLFDVGHAAHLVARLRRVATRSITAPRRGFERCRAALLAHGRAAGLPGHVPPNLGSAAPAWVPRLCWRGACRLSRSPGRAASSFLREPLDVVRVLANDTAYAVRGSIASARTARRSQRPRAPRRDESADAAAVGAAAPLAAACGSLLARLLQTVSLERNAGGDTSSHAVEGARYLGPHARRLSRLAYRCRAARASRWHGVHAEGRADGAMDLFERLLPGAEPEGSPRSGRADAQTCTRTRSANREIGACQRALVLDVVAAHLRGHTNARDGTPPSRRAIPWRQRALVRQFAQRVVVGAMASP